jgi:hemerythrin-like domain-containing protein
MDPIDMIRFVHTAITTEADAFQGACAVVSSADDARSVADRVAKLARVVNGHTHAEEQSVFPALDERAMHVSASYLFDHVDERALFSEIEKVASETAASPSAEGYAHLARLGVALREHLVVHIRKENELILPLVAKLFSVPEQVGIVQKLMASIPPPEMLVAAGWMAARLPAVYRGRCL